MQDFRELNQNSHIDKYSMKEITECLSDIGRANLSIFSTLDLISGLWQMKLDKKSQPVTAFTIPGKGQFHWVTSPMGLLGCPASFQQLMEGVPQNLQNVFVYIDDLLIHSDTHERHLQILEQVLE
jgi:Reverse transcriptase (RNA-dependent DNA polymerase)